MTLLIASTLSVAVIHALAPDHWLPFVMIARAQKWGIPRLITITALAGIGHTLSSFLIGATGILLGFSLRQANLWESARGNIASLLLIGFGLAYMVWAIKHWGKSHHHGAHAARTVSCWTLFALVVFGPCEPLIPLLFLAYIQGWSAIFGVYALFTAATVGMMLAQVTLGYLGISLIRTHWVEHSSHILAGGVIAATGILIRFLGI